MRGRQQAVQSGRVEHSRKSEVREQKWSEQWSIGWEQCGDDVDPNNVDRENIVGLGGRSWILRVFYSTVYMSYSVFHLSLCLKMYVLLNIIVTR